MRELLVGVAILSFGCGGPIVVGEQTRLFEVQNDIPVCLGHVREVLSPYSPEAECRFDDLTIAGAVCNWTTIRLAKANGAWRITSLVAEGCH